MINKKHKIYLAILLGLNILLVVVGFTNEKLKDFALIGAPLINVAFWIHYLIYRPFESDNKK